MCNCITQVNEQLKPHDTEIGVMIMLNPPDVRVELSTYIPYGTKVKRGQKPMRLSAAYCPFCGEKYANISQQEAGK